MNICLVNAHPSLAPIAESMGCAVLRLDTEDTYFDLPQALERAVFRPDAVVQVERLGGRVLLTGLHELDCVKAFWSVDTHMNLHWHAVYGRLFDLVLTTQKVWTGRLESAGVRRVRWLPWYGVRRPFVPHRRRTRDLGFVGRLSEHRPTRMWFAQFLREQYGFAHADGLSRAAMLEYYDSCRVVPNESLFGEINFRLFEGASCGCAVLNPAVSDELAELFDPGREVEVFEHVLDLKYHIDRYRADPDAAMRTGLAAWERVQAEHLPVHRMARLLEYLGQATPGPPDPVEAERALALTSFALWEGGELSMQPEAMLSMLSRWGEDAETVGARMRVLALTGERERLRELVLRAVRSLPRGDLLLDCLLSVAAHRLGEWDVAKLVWYRYVESLENRIAPKPENVPQLLRLWAREMQRANRLMRSGFLFHERKHLPVTAMECLLMALDQDSEDLQTYRRLAQAVVDVRGGEAGRMGFLSHLALHEPSNWRIGLELALTNLRAFRLREGLAELYGVQQLARQAGEQDRLRRILSARDPGGLLVRALENQG